MNKLPDRLPRPPVLPASGTRIVSPEPTPNPITKRNNNNFIKIDDMHQESSAQNKISYVVDFDFGLDSNA